MEKFQNFFIVRWKSEKRRSRCHVYLKIDRDFYSISAKVYLLASIIIPTPNFYPQIFRGCDFSVRNLYQPTQLFLLSQQRAKNWHNLFLVRAIGSNMGSTEFQTPHLTYKLTRWSVVNLQKKTLRIGKKG